MANIYVLERAYALEQKTTSNQQNGATSTFTTQKVVLRDLDGVGRESRFATRIVAEAIDCADLTPLVGRLLATCIKERSNITDKGAYSTNVIREFSLL